MALTFDSKSIAKLVNIDLLANLSRAELILLEEELVNAISNMDKSIRDVKHEKQESGDIYNENWERKVKRKQKICKVFVEKIQSIIANTSGSEFNEVYEQELRKLIELELGLEFMEALKKEAADNAAKKLAKTFIN